MLLSSLIFSIHSLTPPFSFLKCAYRLAKNPVCADKSLSYCSVQQKDVVPYRTSMANCVSSRTCPSDQSQNPANCGCAFSYNGKMVFRAPFFKDVTDSVRFKELETSLSGLPLRGGAVQLSDIHFNMDNYLLVQVKLFPSGTLFNVSDIIIIGFLLSNQTFKTPRDFGPYFFIADPYIPLLGT